MTIHCPGIVCPDCSAKDKAMAVALVFLRSTINSLRTIQYPQMSTCDYRALLTDMANALEMNVLNPLTREWTR